MSTVLAQSSQVKEQVEPETSKKVLEGPVTGVESEPCQGQGRVRRAGQGPCESASKMVQE